MMFNRSFIGDRLCFGNAFVGWHILFILAGVVLLAALIFWLYRKGSRTKDGALNALKMKLIQGDITEDEYLSRKNVLNHR